MAMARWSTRDVAGLLGVRPARLLQLVWNRDVPSPPRKPNGRNYDWTPTAVQRICVALHGMSIEEFEEARRPER